jgi:hypothetical protein
MTITTITRETKTTGRDFAKAGFRIDFIGEGAPDGLPPCAAYFRAPPRFMVRARWRGARSCDGCSTPLVGSPAGSVLTFLLESFATVGRVSRESQGQGQNSKTNQPKSLTQNAASKTRASKTVIPGRCEASNPESRDSGSGAAHHPGMTPNIMDCISSRTLRQIPTASFELTTI